MSESQSQSQTPYRKVSVAQALDIFARGDAALVDVRTAKEHSKQRVEGALWIPINELTERRGELPDDKRLLFICTVGMRSDLAAEYAAAFGFEPQRLYSVKDGGVKEWLALGGAADGASAGSAEGAANG